MGIEENLASFIMGPLPAAPRPVGLYAPVCIVGNIAFVSGQIPSNGGAIKYAGKVGDHNIGEAKESARLCAINVLAQLKAEVGSLDLVKQIVRVTGYVNAEPDFTNHPKVINAASEVFAAAFGKGRHARVAIGAASLPLDAMTEVDAIAEIAS